MLLNACDNHGQNIVAKCRQLSKIGGSLECFTPDVLQFLTQLPKFGFKVADWGLAIKFNLFGDFRESWDFLEILSLKPFGNS